MRLSWMICATEDRAGESWSRSVIHGRRSVKKWFGVTCLCRCWTDDGVLCGRYGKIFRKVSSIRVKEGYLKINRCFCLLIFVIAMLLLFVLYISGVRVGLSHNHYSHAIFLVLAAFSGWFAMLCASHLMGQRICSIVAYIGRHTMPILIFQWLMFRLVNCIGCVFAGRPSYMIAAVPTAFSGSLWGVIYVSVAIGGALILNELWWRVWSRGCATVVKRMSWTQA